LAWKKISFLELDPHETAPGIARAHIRNVLSEWGLECCDEAAQLVTTELLTNSVQAVRAFLPQAPPPVRIWILGAPSQVMVSVWDPLRAAPQPRTAGTDDENGRGLFIVKQYSTNCGHYYPPAEYAPDFQGGKVTWATVSASPARQHQSLPKTIEKGI
jgi:anti-sigma regulatory factor (Ser/Thr protein kinase)